MKQRACESGSILVEFAFSVAVLLTVVFGIMEASLALYSFHLISEAAREGSRYAMVRGNTCNVNGSSCTATPASIQSYVQSLGYPGIDPAKMSVSTSYAAFPANTTCSPNANCENAGNLVTVKVVYTFNLNIPFVPSSLLNMTSTSSMVLSH
jgi:Flp pilus assembly protein TadG